MRVCDQIERDEKVYLGECGGFFNGHTHRRQKTVNVGSTLRTQRGLTTQRQPQINDKAVVVVDASRENSGLHRQGYFRKDMCFPKFRVGFPGVRGKK